jgi:indolepyruvate ferredoxin oxidoreductase beta subunit
MSADTSLRILLAGVGGQGVLTGARVIGEAALSAGLQVRIGQLHGMSQRGGSVEATVVIGPGRTAFVGAGACDCLLALEPLEALRAAPRLKPGAEAWLNTARLVPATLGGLDRPYPPLPQIEQALAARGAVVRRLDAASLAGDARAVSAVMLGVLVGAGRLPISERQFEQAMRDFTPPRVLETTLRAWRLGIDASRRQAWKEAERA